MTGHPTLLMYREDTEFITESTLHYPDIETGGDLFGLWQNERQVVVQLVSGPGRGCRRTPTSFFQDKTYLSDVGNHLVNEKGLCNIGEWHSHHRLNLPEPSHGDKGTVWRNMPGLGLKQFLLIIATITPKREVNINGFIFTAPVRQHQDGEMIRLRTRVLGGPNPFRRQPDVLAKLREGAEVASFPPHIPLQGSLSGSLSFPIEGAPDTRQKKGSKKEKRSKKKKISGNGVSLFCMSMKKNKGKNNELQIYNSELQTNVQPHEFYRRRDADKNDENKPVDARSTSPLIRQTYNEQTYI